jgi:uncharacterized tellurite resistance protein B-like protein
MNSIKAGFYILNIFACIDGRVDPSEITIIFDFLADNFEGEFNLEHEVAMLDTLDYNQRLQLFYQAAEYLRQTISLQSKINLLEYILDLIIIDKRIEQQELDLLRELGKIWGIDSEHLLYERLNAE